MYSVAIAQDESEYAIKLDSTVHNKWSPTGLRFGVDIAGPIYNLFEPKIANYEGMADIDFGKFFVVVEIGTGSYQEPEALTAYTSSGTFYRAGADVNMIAKDPNLNVFYFGVRYATSSFDETLNTDLPDLGWGVQPVDANQTNSRVNWVELNIGMRVRLWDSFFAGYAVRFKLLKHVIFSENNFESYFIPGYGVASNTNNWGISYYVQYRIEWKKKAIKWRDDK